MKKTDEIEKIKITKIIPNFFFRFKVKSLLFSKFSCSLIKAKRKELTAFSYKTKNLRKTRDLLQLVLILH